MAWAYWCEIANFSQLLKGASTACRVPFGSVTGWGTADMEKPRSYAYASYTAGFPHAVCDRGDSSQLVAKPVT